MYNLSELRERIDHNTDVVAHCFIREMGDGEWPWEVVKAVCELYWPGKSFRRDGENDFEDGEMCTLADLICEETGKPAHTLFLETRAARCRKAERIAKGGPATTTT